MSDLHKTGITSLLIWFDPKLKYISQNPIAFRQQIDNKKAQICWFELLKVGAGNEIRTRDPDLGKVVLYQLSYSRLSAFAVWMRIISDFVIKSSIFAKKFKSKQNLFFLITILNNNL